MPRHAIPVIPRTILPVSFVKSGRKSLPGVPPGLQVDRCPRYKRLGIWPAVREKLRRGDTSPRKSYEPGCDRNLPEMEEEVYRFLPKNSVGNRPRRLQLWIPSSRMRFTFSFAEPSKLVGIPTMTCFWNAPFEPVPLFSSPETRISWCLVNSRDAHHHACRIRRCGMNLKTAVCVRNRTEERMGPLSGGPAQEALDGISDVTAG
jgi:hypothetical protein